MPLVSPPGRSWSRPASDHDTMPLLGLSPAGAGVPASWCETCPILQLPSSTAKPRPAHASGRSAISRAASSTTRPCRSQPRPQLGFLPWLAFFFDRIRRLTVRFDMVRPRVAEDLRGAAGPAYVGLHARGGRPRAGR